MYIKIIISLLISIFIFSGCEISNLNNKINSPQMTTSDIKQLVGVSYDDIEKIYGSPEQATYYINKNNLKNMKSNYISLRNFNYYSIIKSYYSINDEMYLVDLPGYGYAKVSEQEKIKWGQLIERYLHSSAQLKAVFLLIDIRHAPSENDRIMYQWIVDQGFHPIIIATKLDKIKRSQVQKQMKVLREGLKLIPGTTIIPFSSQTKQGRDEIWDMVENQFLNQ